jgi:anti-sigma B factor antagonist
MSLTIEQHVPESNDRALLTLEGRLDAVTAPDLKERLKRLAEEGQVFVVIDMSEVSFMDSSGLAALVSGLKALREAGGSLRLAGVNEQAREVFDITRLDQVFKLYPDRRTAVADLPE